MIRGHRLSHTVVDIVSKGFVLLLSLILNIIDYHNSVFVLAQRLEASRATNTEYPLYLQNVERH